MMTILGEDESEVHYVVKNVFRYDRDNDGAVTYTQFVFILLFRPTLVLSSISVKWQSKDCIEMDTMSMETKGL